MLTERTTGRPEKRATSPAKRTLRSVLSPKVSQDEMLFPSVSVSLKRMCPYAEVEKLTKRSLPSKTKGLVTRLDSGYTPVRDTKPSRRIEYRHASGGSGKKRFCMQ